MDEYYIEFLGLRVLRKSELNSVCEPTLNHTHHTHIKNHQEIHWALGIQNCWSSHNFNIWKRMILQHQKVHADRMILFLKAENCHVALGKHAMISSWYPVHRPLNHLDSIKKKGQKHCNFFFLIYMESNNT